MSLFYNYYTIYNDVSKMKVKSFFDPLWNHLNGLRGLDCDGHIEVRRLIFKAIFNLKRVPLVNISQSHYSLHHCKSPAEATPRSQTKRQESLRVPLGIL